jgi:hypothetical protein
MASPVPLPLPARPAAPAERTSRRRKNLRRLLAVAGSTLALVAAAATPAFAAPPAELPGNAEVLERTWQPAYDYDTNGCYPTPAVGPGGAVNGGLNPTGSLSGECHDTSDLDNTNGYSRYKCNNGWCAIAYGLYFEKDQALANSSIGGHRHDWEHVVVWVQNNQAVYVSTSAHGQFTVHPASSVRWDGTHPKIVYHKDGASTHTFRLGNSNDEPPENAYGTWQYPSLVGWNGYPSTAVRDALSNYDFGSANFGLKDGNFATTLSRAMPAGIAFDPNSAAPSNLKLVNRATGKCLDVHDWSTADGGEVLQWACTGGDNQRWRAEPLGDGTSRIINANSDKVLDVTDCGTADGTDIGQYTWWNNNCQRWQLADTDGGWFRLLNPNSGKVADVADCNSADGTAVRLWTWLNNQCQQWSLQP